MFSNSPQKLMLICYHTFNCCEFEIASLLHKTRICEFVKVALCEDPLYVFRLYVCTYVGNKQNRGGCHA